MKKIIFILLFFSALNALYAETAKGNLNLNIEAENKPILTQTISFQLKNAKAIEIKPLIGKFLSQYGSVDINSGLNIIFVNDLPEKLESLKEALVKLDDPNNKYDNGVKTELIQLKYINPNYIASYITYKLSAVGRFFISSDLNSIIVSDLENRIKEIKDLVLMLDKPRKQVLLKIKIIEIKYDDSQNVGIDWNEIFGAGHIAFSYTPINSKTMKFSGNEMNVDTFNGTKQNNGFKLELGADILNLDKLINLLMVNGVARVISSPSIIAENNGVATFNSSEEIPGMQYNSSRQLSRNENNNDNFQSAYQDYKSHSNGTNETKNLNYWDANNENSSFNAYTSSYSTFKLEALRFNITPHVNEDLNINMGIDVVINSFLGLDKSSQPIIFNRSINTRATIPDKMTFILGGLEKRSKVSSINRVPLLGYIPVLNLLFQKKTEIVKISQIIMLITPEIIDDPKQNILKDDIDIKQLEEKLKKIKKSEKKD